MCKRLHAKLSRCEQYRRGFWITDQEIDNDVQWSRPAPLEWPIDLAAFNEEFVALTASVEKFNWDVQGEKLVELWNRHWPAQLRKCTRASDELKAWKVKHFAPIRYLLPTPNQEECTERILDVLDEEPCPPNLDLTQDTPLPLEKQIQVPPLPPAVSTYDHPFILGWPYSDEWWECFVAASYEQAERDRPSGPFCESIMNIGLQHLKWRLGPGQRWIVFTTMAVRADLPIRDDVIFDTFFNQLPITGIIGIACTDSLYHYYNRPDEDTYQWLLKIFGAPPAWFRSPFSLREFNNMCAF